MACSGGYDSYGCDGCENCAGPSGYGAMQPPHEYTGGYGAVDPAAPALFHQFVEQLEDADILGSKASDVLHQGGSVLMPVGGTYKDPEDPEDPEDPRRGFAPNKRGTGAADGAGAAESARTPVSTPAVIGFLAGGAALGKLLGNWFGDR
jgi:hypothetical protein